MGLSRQSLAIVAGIGLATALPSFAQTEKAGTPLPGRIQVGSEVLILTSCGVRDTLWVAHFVAALYLPAEGLPAQSLLDESRPKAVRIEILNSDWLPDRKPEKWREPLRTSLSSEGYRTMQRLYSSLRAGDVVMIQYRPLVGVTVARNADFVLNESGHGVIEALVTAWAPDEPAAEKARRLVEEHPC